VNWHWVRRGAVVAAIVAFLLFRDQLPDFNLEEIVEDLSQGLGKWTYLLVGALAFLETGAFVGLVAPGEFTVILGGAVAGQGDISLPLILAITWFAAFAGDSVSFALGARLGRGFLVRHGDRFRIGEQRLRQVEDYFDRHGGKTILIGRFIGLVRALAPFIAGTSGMRYSAFAPYSILGTGLWSTALILAGYFASQSLDVVANAVGTGLLVFGVLVGTIVAITLAVRWLRRPENRRRLVEELEQRRLLRPLLVFGRWVRPEARFLWARLTPGELGLELTSLLAVLAVGLFLLISYWSVVAGDPGPTPGDRTWFDLAQDIRMDWLDGLAKGVTRLGASYVVLPLAALSAIALAVLRRWAELVVLVASMAVIALGGPEIKELTERPRPSGGLIDAGGYAFPSGHAAYSTFYTWLAVTLAWSVVPGITRRGLVIGVGLALTAVIGLSRVYLGVHWFSDVVGGWALGFSAFAGFGAIALIVSHIRDNLAHERGGEQPRRRAAAGDRT
jgi:membrane protein DedA with SNARE-associated domain/membrane-associated phospholipid phosphatase